MTLIVNASALAGLQKKLKAFSAEVKNEVAMHGVATMAGVIYEEVKVNVPVKSGTLQSAIYRVYSPEKSTDSLKLYRVSWNHTEAPHGHLIEFGTSRSPARPFMRPAASHIGDSINAGKQAMSVRIKELQ